MKWQLGLKRKSSREADDVQKVGSRMVRIKSLGVFGPFSESENGQYLLARQDSDRERGIGGYRELGNGKFALVENGRVAFVGECERPTAGEVANTGTFVIADSLFGKKISSSLFIYSANGELRLSHSFLAKIFNIGISFEGTHVVAQLCNSETDDSGRIYLFDVSESKVISAFNPEGGWADKYKFSVPEKIIYLCHDNKESYKYLFDGTFLGGNQRST